MGTLITGAGGFLGGHLTEVVKKISGEAPVHALGLTTREGLPEVALVDLSDPAATKRFVNQAKPEVVYHLAGISRVAATVSFADYFTHNFLSTVNLVMALAERQASVTVLFTSTAHVYGNPTEAIDERSEVHPLTAYGFTKYLAEEYLREAAQQHPFLRVRVVRLYNFIGPGQAEGYVVPDLCQKIRKLPTKLPVLEVGPLDGRRDFTDVRDVASILPQIIETVPNSPFEIFNLTSGHSLAISELLEHLLTIGGKAPKIQSTPRDTHNPFQGLKMNAQKLRTALPTLQFRPIKETLKETYEAFGKGP